MAERIALEQLDVVLDRADALIHADYEGRAGIRVLRDPKLRQALQTADKPEKIITLLREAENKM